MSLLKNKKIVAVIIAVVLIGGFLFIYFSDGGLKEYYRLDAEVKELREQLDAERKKVEAMGAEIDSLKYNKEKIEKVAREKYMMKAPNEEGFNVVEN